MEEELQQPEDSSNPIDQHETTIVLSPTSLMVVRHEATFGDLLISVLLMLLIMVVVVNYVHRLIFRRGG